MQQPSFGARLVTELLERLPPALLLLEMLVALGHGLTAEETARSTPLPCTSCPKSGTPHEPCNRLEVYLDSIHKGKLHGEKTIGMNLGQVRDRKAVPGQDDGDEAASQIDRGTFRNYRKVESFDAMESYKQCWHLLSPKQREVVHLHYGEGKSESEIATLLERKRNTVSGLLKRAKKTKEEHDVAMRRQELELQREFEARSGEI